MVTSFTSTKPFQRDESPAEQAYIAALAFEDMLGELPAELTSCPDRLTQAVHGLEEAIITLQAEALRVLAQDGRLTIKDCT